MAPFQSESQRKFMWAKHPDLAKKWAHEYPGQKNLPEHKNYSAHVKAAMKKGK